WKEGHIEQAEHQFLGRLPQNLDALPRDKKLVVHCRGGARSAIAVSVLQAAGLKNAVNLAGGYMAWKADGLASVTLPA
ncbi:MAG: rhodanese-like domain-containing protein, partial [Planctomycetota bacterium]